ncbi:hypothetical protein P153DRAFT_147275 [Dothidotthia symphoricarpi CBS 119687]|uniref:Uncharacterized protein n=1 Tax=Dothidotthia symphoricarpi CBS 119687 TaxID=1392245 RepID=A0A6A5ZVP7_9PLEO|nr:uncharacterized protein P153DRAFT_147275 [Dothidotthia symphoricarpi CBS 119687]KAF2123670.1 hypothetical protein P153DRAFT_147275 [Dothidotthia symphoricarpi CBS 119687]
MLPPLQHTSTRPILRPSTRSLHNETLTSSRPVTPATPTASLQTAENASDNLHNRAFDTLLYCDELHTQQCSCCICALETLG